jgi:hypothetical protein
MRVSSDAGGVRRSDTSIEVASLEFGHPFRLLPPPGAKALGREDSELAEPRVMLKNE